MTGYKKKRLIEQTAIPSKGIYDALPQDVEEAFEETQAEDALSGHGPIDPAPQMAVQLSVAEPPVDDEQFVPGSVEELTLAASTITKAVPSSEVEWYYKQLHKLVDQANSRVFDETHQEETEEVEVINQESEEVQEESVRRTIRKALFEILDAEDEDEFDRYRGAGIDYFADEEVEVEEVPEAPDASDSVSLEDMATEFGYSGAPGMRQEIQRITDRMEYFSNNVKKEDLDALLGYAVGEYIDTLEAADVLDEEDLQDLRSAPSVVRELDTFRYFFVSAFVLPAYKEVAREAMKKVKSGISEMGLPKELEQTVLNQVSGGAQRKPQIIKSKLMKLAQAGKIQPEEVTEFVEKINSAMPALTQAGELSDNLVERALEKWQGVAQKKRLSMLNKAMEQTA